MVKENKNTGKSETISKFKKRKNPYKGERVGWLRHISKHFFTEFKLFKKKINKSKEDNSHMSVSVGGKTQKNTCKCRQSMKSWRRDRDYQ